MAVVLLGLSLWAQLCGPTIFASGISPWLVFIALLPLVVAGFGFQMKSGVGMLLLFPVSTLPALAAMPETAHLALGEPFGMFRIVLTLTLYLAATGAWLSGTVPAQGSATDGQSSEGSIYRWYVRSRGLVLILMLLVLVWAVYFDGAILSAIAANHPDGERVAQSFIAIVAFFVWTVVAYTQFLVPLLNLEYDRRKLERAAREKVKMTTLKGSLKRIAAEAAVLGCLAVLLMVV